MQRPRVLARERLVALHLRRGVDVPAAVDLAEGPLAEVALDAVVDREVDRPGREVAEDGGTKPPVESAEAVVFEDAPDGGWGTQGVEKDVR